MPTKKVTPGAKKSKPNGNGDGFLHLEGALFWKWRAVDAEYRNAALGMERKQAEIAEEIKKHPDLVRLIGERDSLAVVTRGCVKEMEAVQKEIEATLRISLQNASIDDKSGRVFILEDGQQVPVKPTKATKAKSANRRTTATS